VKEHNPDDGHYDPNLDDPPSREQQEADYFDEQIQLMDLEAAMIKAKEAAAKVSDDAKIDPATLRKPMDI
jgi:hypothetical protein